LTYVHEDLVHQVRRSAASLLEVRAGERQGCGDQIEEEHLD